VALVPIAARNLQTRLWHRHSRVCQHRSRSTFARLPSGGVSGRGAADIDPRRRELAELDGIPHVYQDYRELMARDDVQIIDCAVDHLHMPARIQMLKDAAKAGKAVLMQSRRRWISKPRRRWFKSPRSMDSVRRQSNLRFDPAIYTTRQFLTPERFGKPAFIQFSNIRTKVLSSISAPTGSFWSGRYTPSTPSGGYRGRPGFGLLHQSQQRIHVPARILQRRRGELL